MSIGRGGNRCPQLSTLSGASIQKDPVHPDSRQGRNASGVSRGSEAPSAPACSGAVPSCGVLFRLSAVPIPLEIRRQCRERQGAVDAASRMLGRTRPSSVRSHVCSVGAPARLARSRSAARPNGTDRIPSAHRGERAVGCRAAEQTSAEARIRRQRRGPRRRDRDSDGWRVPARTGVQSLAHSSPFAFPTGRGRGRSASFQH
jgi:hypothetical protein